jgi:tripartite-type tricarboxylate transporter receptor subunit TctC
LNITTRALCILMASLSWLIARPAISQNASDYPAKPVRVIVPFAAGSTTDTFTRAIGQQLSTRLKQPFVIDNRPGASQLIALEAVAKAPADGYTIFLATQSGLVFLTGSRKALPYNPVTDFSSITLMYESPLYLLVRPEAPVKTVKELIDWVRSQPGKLNYPSIGVGSTQHLAMEMFRARAGIDMVHVPYKGSPQIQAALLSGEVQVVFDGALSVPLARTGKLRVLASSGVERSQAAPELPTIAESGVPDFNLASWFGLGAPAGVPRAIIDKLNAEVGDFLRSPAGREKLASFNVDLRPSTPEQMASRIRNEIPVFTKAMRAAGIEAE